ncbi:hypothetical protein ID866_5838 [Astraeus odoratus]|nr:hypothetical protein ID866_5838 [Astraeus odoratus]
MRSRNDPSSVKTFTGFCFAGSALEAVVAASEGVETDDVGVAGAGEAYRELVADAVDIVGAMAGDRWDAT